MLDLCDNHTVCPKRFIKTKGSARCHVWRRPVRRNPNHHVPIPRIVLAHELIRHWEHIGAVWFDALPQPDEADRVIALIFQDSIRERGWRASHSRRFIAEAAAVAQDFGIEFRLCEMANECDQLFNKIVCRHDTSLSLL